MEISRLQAVRIAREYLRADHRSRVGGLPAYEDYGLADMERVAGPRVYQVLSVEEGGTEARDHPSLDRYFGRSPGFRTMFRRSSQHCWRVCIGHTPPGWMCGPSTMVWVDQRTGEVVQTAFDPGG